jgi:aspartyl-tRNA(Asn)/glutamyl-tRNA(Gln) amidotransferase subunit B
MNYQPVIGLEIHAELLTRSKMFCACPVVDLTTAAPNSAVCEVCAGMPGTLPVVNARAVEYALRVALALNCRIHLTSLFARKNYFYPDLPKGFQISQYEQPLAVDGSLPIRTAAGGRTVRIRRVHLEEDTGKLTHVGDTPSEPDSEAPIPDSQSPIPNPRVPAAHSLIDLNRAGVPLLEIVTEPDLHSAEEVSAYARALRQLLRYLGVNSGDMEKGVLRIEPNISVRPAGSGTLGTRTEIKNLNSFRALERATAYEIARQTSLLEQGKTVTQQTVGWDEARQVTVPQRSKEEAHDYRYFPEPDLPPLTLDPAWVDEVRASLPELPHARLARFQSEYGLSEYDAAVLTAEKETADYFEQTLARGADPKTAANWITGELFSLLSRGGGTLQGGRVPPANLAELLGLLGAGAVSPASAKRVLAEMFATGDAAASIVRRAGLDQVSDEARIRGWVQSVLAEHPGEVQSFREGKAAVANWLFGQVMRQAGGRANPQVVRAVLLAELEALK